MTTCIELKQGNLKLIDIEPTREGLHILIYADGSCHVNPGPGGYAAVLRRMDGNTPRKKPKVLVGHDIDSTNVRMEMTAVAAALEFLRPGEPEPIVIYSDNNLIASGMNDWVRNWVARGWRKSDGKPVENRDLWERLLAAADSKAVEWRWVRGHAGHPYNEEVDRLARRQMEHARAASYGFAA